MFYSTVILSIFAFLSAAEAFVPQQSIATRSVQQTNLHALDPVHIIDSASTLLSGIDVLPGTSGEVSYSRASYYTILGLYALSFPGIYSTVKRSTKAKMKRKTYVTKGETDKDGKSLREQAGEIMACKYLSHIVSRFFRIFLIVLAM